MRSSGIRGEMFENVTAKLYIFQAQTLCQPTSDSREPPNFSTSAFQLGFVSYFLKFSSISTLTTFFSLFKYI